MPAPVLRIEKVFHMRLGRGGYVYGYRIVDEAGTHVGDKSVRLEKRDAKAVMTYTLGEVQFGTAAEFLEAYKTKIQTEKSDQEWEAAAP